MTRYKTMLYICLPNCPSVVYITENSEGHPFQIFESFLHVMLHLDVIVLWRKATIKIRRKTAFGFIRLNLLYWQYFFYDSITLIT